MTVIITPTKLKGTVRVPPSKSQAHRLLIAAALAGGDSLIRNIAWSEDIKATVRCLTELGAGFEERETGLLVHGMGANSISAMRRLPLPHLDCGESGSTLRFLIPVALAVRGGGVFTGRGRLMERPLEPYFEIFREKGIFFEQKDGVLTVQGTLTPGEYRLPGNVSSQFFTGLLYALPLLDGPSAVIPTTRELESVNYIIMTLQAMEEFGVRTAATMSLPPRYHVAGGQTYRAAGAEAEGDWSNAGFWYAAKALGNEVDIASLSPDSAQGDRVINKYYVNLKRPGDVTIDVSQCPDLVPALAAMGAVRQGTTRIVGAGRLRIKESDRLAAVREELCKLGAEVEEGEDSLTITGAERLRGGVTVDAHNDHRIAMMLAIAATRCQGPVTLTGAESVRKSYPNFWKDYVNLGGKADGLPDEDSKENYVNHGKTGRAGDKLKLVVPTAAYAGQIAAYRQEFLDAGSSMDGCGALARMADPMEWLEHNRLYEDPATLPPGKVCATPFLTVRESDGRVVGMIQVRHTLNEYLRRIGGNIGYSIRPSERRKGYAAEQLRLVLPYCRDVLGLDRVLVTCLTDNEGSRRTILKNGGVYETTNHDPEGDVDLELYWIQLT